MLTPAHIQRLIARKLDPKLAQSYGLSSTPDGTGIVFEYRVRGQVHNRKVRRGKGNMPWEAQGRPLALWNLDCLEAPPVPDEPLIITEGEFDGLALLQASFSRVVSVPNGAPAGAGEAGDRRYTYLYQDGTDILLPNIDKFQTIILAVDGDAKGQYLRDALAVRLGDARCLWVSWPEGCKDANEALIKHGEDALRNMIWGAKRMWIDHVARFSDIPDEGPLPVYELGQALLDRPLREGGIRLPQYGFVTVSGPANHGKSVFCRQIVWQLWRRYGAPFAITAFEEMAKPTYQHEFRTLAIGKDADKATPEEIANADIELESAAVIILPPLDSGIDVSRLLADAEFAIKVYGVRVVLIDPANEVERDSNPEATGDMIKALKRLANRYRVLIITIAHPPVDIVRKKSSMDLWTLYDIEGGRHWAGKSDAGFMLWRRDSDTLLHFAKSKRFKEMGAKILYRMRHNWDTNTFEAVESGDQILKAQGKAASNGSGSSHYSSVGGS